MKVSNNYGQINAFDSNKVSAPKLKNNYKDSFQKGNSIGSPIGRINNVPVNSLYSSNQLLKAYANRNYLQKIIESNPEIEAKLKEKGINAQINPNNILNIIPHLNKTSIYAMQIANELNITPSDKKILEQACMFHDFGKILIPKEILQKPTQLTSQEKDIMSLHAELGADLLKETGMNKKVLELIKNHHNPQKVNNNELESILAAADIFSALKEERSYKKALTNKEAFNVLDQKAEKGELSFDVVSALKNIYGTNDLA